MHKDPSTKKKVMEVVAQYIRWCFNVASEGVLPSRGFYKEESWADQLALMMG